MSLALLISLSAKQPPVVVNYQSPNYEDPRHPKSPYSELANAVSVYAEWYSKIPQYFTDGSIDSMHFKKACQAFKKEHSAIEIIIDAAEKQAAGFRR